MELNDEPERHYGERVDLKRLIEAALADTGALYEPDDEDRARSVMGALEPFIEDVQALLAMHYVYYQVGALPAASRLQTLVARRT